MLLRGFEPLTLGFEDRRSVQLNYRSINKFMELWKNKEDYLEKSKHLPHIGLLETMATFSCTLACDFCSNYSDYNMRGGYVRWKQMKEWLDTLFSRLVVHQFQIIGGEPFLNPELNIWIDQFKTLYPYTTLKIVTNGTLLEKNLWILESFSKFDNIILEISNHQPDQKYVDNFKDKMFNTFDNWEQVESNDYIKKWRILNTKKTFAITNNGGFLKTYKNNYGNMKPYNNNPADAFEICTQQFCPLFVDGKLFKCSTAGLLHRVLQDHNQIDDDDWKPFLNSGLPLDCTDEELKNYADNYGKPNPICRMCPTLDDNPWHEHLSRVRSKI